MKPMITLEDIRGVFAMLPTPSTAEASKADAPFSVDLAETERATLALIAAGVGGIMTNGSLGEMATLSLEEWTAFNEVVLRTARAAKPNLPVFVGVTTLSTRGTIALAREVHRLGGKGIFTGRPFWCPLDDAAMLDFHEALAEAVPDLAIVLYDNPEAFKGPIPTAVYGRLSKIPQVLAAKYIALTPKFNQDVAAVGDRMRLLPIEVDWFAARTMWPDLMPACWSSTVACGPAPIMALAEALEEGRVDRSRELTKRIGRTYAPFLAMQNWLEFTKYNIPLEKLRFDAAGFIKAGPPRHPYHTAPKQYVDGALEAARRWVELCNAVSAEPATFELV